MKKKLLITLLFVLLAGFISAQDLIFLRDGNIIEAKITEISPTEIRYKRFSHLDGPDIVVPAKDVLSMRYENGTVEILNPLPAAPAFGAASGQTGQMGQTIPGGDFVSGSDYSSPVAAAPASAATEVKSAAVRKNWISSGIGISPILGVRYERMLGSKTSLGLRVNFGVMGTNQDKANNIGQFVAVESVFRWYPAGRIFFMGIGAGYYSLIGDLVTGTERYGYNNTSERDITETYTTHAGGSSVEFGWKWDPGRAGAFFLELAITGAIAIGRNRFSGTAEIGGIGGLFFGMGGSF